MKSNNETKKEPVQRCPNCGSAQISLTKRGYSVLFGYIGANTLYNLCRKCGHKWKYKKNA